MRKNTNIILECPVTATMTLIGGKWKPVIIYALSGKTRRFGEIAARVPGISRKVLSEQLKQLEEDGLVSRKQFNEIPPRVEYTLTPLGDSLQSILLSLADWGIKNVISAV
ncbi:MAG: helix-turn-helix transcriptional regulator [Cyclobacteriaceae bacterium]